MMLFKKRADAPMGQYPPLPKVLNPSGTFDGNDGKWSTFTINIAGDGEGAGQNFKVLPATSWLVTIAPRRSDWCPDEACAKTRGIGSFDGRQSLGLNTTSPPAKSWKDAGTYELYYPPWWSKDTMMVNVSRSTGELYGQTTVGLNEASRASITLNGQFVVAYSGSDFFLGSLGLQYGDVSLTTAQGTSFMKTLAHPDNPPDLGIPSRSYGYTAGAYYKNDKRGAPGSLIFGGYDGARINRNDGVIVRMANERNTTLQVGVQSILYQPKESTGSNIPSLTANPNNDGTATTFDATIDSSIPYLVLPNVICDRFAEKFQLTYDRNLGLYTVNETAQTNNQQQAATISFKIGSSTRDSTQFTNIKLPYSAFDLEINRPLVNNATKYFPIRRGGGGPYVLGRTFLQEAYIIVDYERLNFTVSPALFPEALKPEIISIFNTSYVPSKPDKGGGDGLAAGAIAGIVVGIVALFVLIGAAAFFFWRRRQREKANMYSQEEKPSEIDTTAAGREIKPRRVSELTGSDVPTSPSTTIGGTYYGADHKKHPAIMELSPESQPVELYSPPLGSNEMNDYFATAPHPQRRGATRNSSGHNTPGTPVAELAGDFRHQEGVVPLQRPQQHSRSPSDTSLTTNIDEVLASNDKDEPQVHRKGSSRFIEHTGEHERTGPSRAEQVVSPLEDGPTAGATATTSDRRPSHTRGLSDTTINSESTAVSEPTAEERERWANTESGPRRPLSQ